MPGCRTNCIEKSLSEGFDKFGKYVGRHPWWFLMVPLFLSAGLSGGFYFLEEMESKATGIENQFTPVNGPAKKERLVVKTNFPHDGDSFSHQRLYTEGTYGSLIFTKTTHILVTTAFSEMLEFNGRVLMMQVEDQDFNSLCAMNGGVCMSNSFFDVLNGSTGQPISYPIHNNVFIGSEIGGVELRANTDKIEIARAVRLFYFLKEDNATVNNLWLKQFIDMASGIKGKEVNVSYFTSLSREEEFEKSSDSIIPFFSVTYVLAINFSIWSCMRLDCVRNKVWVAAFGVLSAGLAVLSSFGLLLYCGMPFTVTVATSPFLILGIGVDDMFIMISCWQRTKVTDRVEDRMAATYREAAVSITITTLTDALAFYIGLLTPFRSVQSFCMYTGTAVIFCFLYSITFFGAFLALNGRREKDNRHWFTCLKVPKPKADSPKYNMCCVGGVYDLATGKEERMPVYTFFEKYYGPFLTNRWTKVMVVLLYAGYLASSIYGCFKIKEGIDLKNLASDGSYVSNYYDNEDEYFSDYGPSVMVVVTDRDFKYWNKSTQDQLDTCLQTFGNLTFENRSLVDDNLTISWLHEYLQYGDVKNFDLSDKKTFIDNLPVFFNASPATHGFKQDVNFSVSEVNIYASRMFIQTVNIRTAVDEKNLLNKVRELAKSDVCPGSLVVYHSAFIFYDQYAVIVSNAIQNIVVATLAMLVVSLILIPNPICSLWVTFAIGSIIVGVAGFMALWDVNLDSISMINLVICIGFSVDFSAHISYAFVSSKKSTANEKAIDAVFNLGYPIIQGAVSTILGVVVLSASESYIFRTFFKIMLLVITFGVIHGIVFLPVFLTFFGTCGLKVCDDDSSRPNTSDQSNNIPVNQVPKTTPCLVNNWTRTSVQSNHGIFHSRTNSGVPNKALDPDCP